MPEDFVNAELNRLLVAVRRSLLQYMGECWPWTDPKHQEAQQRFVRLIGRQESGIANVVELLVRRGWIVDFGVYPTEFTDLHYVALDFLIARAVDNQRSVLAEVEAHVGACASDPEAFALVQHVAAVEREVLDELQAMQRTGNTTAGISAG